MKIFVRWVWAAALAAGCAGVRMAPSAAEIRSVAFVGLSMNAPFRDTDRSKWGADGAKGAVEKTLLDEDNAARQALLQTGRDAFVTHFGALERWRFMTQETLAAHPAFQTALREKGWTRAPESQENPAGLLPASPDDLSVRVADLAAPKTPTVRERLAALARDLDVDAVAVVRMDMGYTLTGKTNGGLAEGRPDVAAQLAVVTREGDIVVQAMKTTRFITEPVGLARRDGTAAPDTARALKLYKTAVASSAEMLAEDLEKKLAESR